ncbi:hypothetical protein L6R52_24305 [Myxococcota bacterium]|nr:hypothetical protein [Myxococcota bacterium]
MVPARSLVALVALFGLACSGEPAGDCNPACTAGTVCSAGACVPVPSDAGVSDAGASDAGGVDAASPQLMRVDVEPPTVTLTSVNGSRPEQRFTVTAVWSDGTALVVQSARFELEPSALGAIDATQTFRSNGRVGGSGVVRAIYNGLAGEAQLRVELEDVLVAPGTSTRAPDLFATTGVEDPARAATIAYPPDGVIMPQNVQPPSIQWNVSAPGDVFRVRLVKPSARTTIYVASPDASFPDAIAPELGAWRRLGESDPDAWAEIFVDRWEAATGQVVTGAPVKVKLARAALLGAIYYWDIVAGRIVRINDADASRDAFLPNPPLGCVGCHSVSTSGRYMAGRFGGGDNVGSVFDLTQDLTGNPPPTRFAIDNSIRWWFSTWSPDDTRLLVTKDEGSSGRLALLDPASGAELPTMGAGLPAMRATHPSWSPDGSAIAFVGNNDAWGGANQTGDIFLLPVTGLDAFAAPVRLVDGTTVPGLPAGNAASYPTWSPDTSVIAFAHGNSSRSENGASALYAIRRDGTGLVRLDAAAGGTDTSVDFQPRFAPFHQGGYYWLTFLSRRDYGNAKAGTRGTGRQQIWVTAIRDDARPGEDPSAPAYWLPGQDTTSLNISAFWAERACLANAEGCTTDAECCTGECSPEGQCVELTSCRGFGEPCTDNAQCCNGVLCIDSVCGSF